MRPLALLLCGLALSPALPAPVFAGELVRAPALRGAQCLDPERARTWVNEDERHLLVDSGRYKYRIEVAPACTALGYSQLIGFRGDPVLGRVCGGLGDAVLTRDYPCRIERMELLSKEQYRQAVKDRRSYRKFSRGTRKS